MIFTINCTTSHTFGQGSRKKSREFPLEQGGRPPCGGLAALAAVLGALGCWGGYNTSSPALFNDGVSAVLLTVLVEGRRIPGVEPLERGVARDLLASVVRQATAESVTPLWRSSKTSP